MFFGKVLIAYGLILLLLKQIHIFRKKTVFFLLFFLWVIAYIYSPYWLAFGSFGFPNFKYVAFIGLSLFGLLWAHLCASDLKLPKVKIHTLPLLTLGLLLYVVNVKQLNADIPWRGDEDAHIVMLLRLKEYFTFFFNHVDKYLFQNPLFWALILFIVLSIYLFFIRRRRRVVNIMLACIMLSLIAVPSLILFSDSSFADQNNIFLLSDILRYPFFQKWVNFIFIAPSFYDISLYRIVPFLSIVGIALFLFYVFCQKLQSKILAVLLSIAFTTTPLLLFYSSILYLEMPSVFLMLICVWNIKILIKDDADKLKKHYVWYFLLILSFLKETVLIFLLMICTVRMIYQTFTRYKTNGVLKPLFSEFKILLLVLSPVIIYISFRNTFAPYLNAPFGFYLSNILSTANYTEVVRSLIVQAGVLPILGIFGLIVLAKKNILVTRVIVIMFIGILVSFFVYLHKDYMQLAGYSRWNLFFLPMILYPAVFFVAAIAKRRRIYGYLILLMIFAFNILLFPFKSDGVRLPNWGAPLMDVAEYTYPYDEAMGYLSKGNTDTLLLAGQYSPHWGLRFYFEKYNFYPNTDEYYFGSKRFDKKTERQKLDDLFNSHSISADEILYHSVNNIDLDMSRVYGGQYKIAKRVQNSLHSIYIFETKK